MFTVTIFLSDVIRLNELAMVIAEKQAYSPEEMERIFNANIHLQDALYALEYDYLPDDSR